MSGKVWVKTDVSGDGSIKFKKEKWKVEITCKESLSQNPTCTCEMTGSTLSFFCRILNNFNSAMISEAYGATVYHLCFHWFGSIIDFITCKAAG